MDLLIKEGTLVDSTRSYQANICIDQGKIHSIFEGSKQIQADKVINAKDLLIFPGVIDSHVHFQLQDLGKIISSDTFASGTHAAAFGGVTTVIDFADQTRGESPYKGFLDRKKNADKQVAIDYSLHVSLTDTDFLDEIPLLIKEGVTSFKFFTSYSWRNLSLDDFDLIKLFQEMQKNRCLLMGHCENDILVLKGRQSLVKRGKTDPIYHAYSRPHIVEEEAIQRVILFAKKTGIKLHIAHITTKEGGELLANAKLQGLKVTGETCPHYLLLNEGAYNGPKGYLNIMSPPLRHTKDQQGLLDYIKDKIIDQIVTDHCEFSRESKGSGNLPFEKIVNGIPGIETSLPLMHDLLINKLNLSYSQLVNLMSTQPAKLFGLYPKKGSLEIGADADLIIFDPTLKRLISPEILHYNIDWNPFEGIKVVGWPIVTILRGKILVENGEFIGPSNYGQFQKRNLVGK